MGQRRRRVYSRYEGHHRVRGDTVVDGSTMDRGAGMNDSLVILDPTDERTPIGRKLAARPNRLQGTLGIIDIAKARGDVFCDELEQLVRQRLPELDIIRLRKPTYTKPAPENLRNEVGARCHAVIQALAD